MEYFYAFKYFMIHGIYVLDSYLRELCNGRVFSAAFICFNIETNCTFKPQVIEGKNSRKIEQ